MESWSKAFFPASRRALQSHNENYLSCCGFGFTLCALSPQWGRI
jgi:hypothetical protein